MKKYLLILILFIAFQGLAQTRTTTVAVAAPPLDKNSVVKDDSGMQLPSAIWKKMMSSGEYILKRSTQAVDEYVIYKMSEKEKAIALELRKNYATNLPKPKQSEAFQEGTAFNGVKITDMNGNKFDLRKADGKVYVLNFWFVNCPPCKKEIPQLNELVAKYKDNKDVVFLAIALDNYTILKDFLKTMPFNYNIVDDGRYYADRYKVKAFPTHVIVGKDGQIKFSTLGLAANTIEWIDKTIKEQVTSN